LTLVVIHTDRPGLISIPPALTATVIEESRMRVRDGGRGGIVVELFLTAKASVHDLVAAMLSTPPSGGRGLPAHGNRIGLADIRTTAWAAGDAWARPVSHRTLDVPVGDIAPVDVVIGPDIRHEKGEAVTPALLNPHFDQAGWGWAATASPADLEQFASRAEDPALGSEPWMASSALLPPVDVATVSPQGFVTTPTLGGAKVECRPGTRTWIVRISRSTPLTVLDVEQGIGEDAIADLRPLRSLAVDPSDAPGPVDLATLLATLSAAGVPITLDGPLPATTAQLLGPLASVLVKAKQNDFTDDVEREAWSVRVRRQALLRFSASAKWGFTGSPAGRTTGPTPSVSVILATRRPENLAFALGQIEQQTWPEVEVNVVLHGVSGKHPSVVRAVEEYSRPIRLIEVDGSVIFGGALNAGLDACSGRFVAKMDDDDWYGPNHLTDLLLAHQYSGANLVGLADHYVYMAQDDVTIRDVAHGTERAARRVSGGTLALAREDMLAAGGWRPVFRAVDRCLMQAVRALGGTLYAMHDLGFCLYRGPGELHTWNPGTEHFLARDPHKWSGLVLPPEVTAVDHPALSQA
jgi:hypothetical protein